MAVRPIFIPVNDANALSVTKDIDFLWAPGMAKVQKQKSIRAMHAVAKTHGINSILEISSKSEDELGVALSAFNLKIKTKKLSKEFSVESAFQASKVFENGGPYVDLLEKDSRDAKRDIRLKESGNLVSFKFYNTVWSLLPRTAFYDWLYLSALNQNKKLAENLLQFDAFTDIEFNPVKSINCQARTAALFVSLTKKNMLSDVLKSQEDFLTLLAPHYGLSRHSIQQNLI